VEGDDEGESDGVVDERTSCILERIYEMWAYSINIIENGSAFNVPPVTTSSWGRRCTAEDEDSCILYIDICYRHIWYSEYEHNEWNRYQQIQRTGTL
jgi:hypothetical protein